MLITEKEVVFVECKFNLNGKSSPWKAQSLGAEKRFEEYVKMFPEILAILSASNLKNEAVIAKIKEALVSSR